MIWLYRILCAIAYICALPFLLYLSTKTKYRESIPSRFFPFLYLARNTSTTAAKYTRIIPHSNATLWFHACSFGEVKSLEPIIRVLNTHHILLTTTTQTGYELAHKLYTESSSTSSTTPDSSELESSSIKSHASITIAYMPFEIFVPLFAKRLPHLQALIVTEAELWLELFYTAKRLGARTLLINARISQRSYPRYMRFRALYRTLFSYVDMVFSQTQEDTKRLKTLGVRECKSFGNLKILNHITPSKHYTKPQRLLIIGASTHKGEEELILQAFNALLERDSTQKVITHPNKQACPDKQNCDTPLLILAPRHPERFELVAKLLEQIPYVRFSSIAQSMQDSTFAPESTTTQQTNHTTNSTQDSTLAVESTSALESILRDERKQILLLDALGELTNFYAIADIVILGGSFVPVGGHNPLEPAAFHTKLISGPHIFNQKALFACISGYTICEAHALQDTLLAHQNLSPTRYKSMEADMTTLLQAITAHRA